MTIAGAASDNSQASQSPSGARAADKRLEGGEVGVEAQPVADLDRGNDEEGRGRRIGDEGHRRGDRDIGAERHRQQRRADDLQPGDHQEDADEQADGDPARAPSGG